MRSVKKSAKRKRKRRPGDYIRMLIFAVLIGGFLYTLTMQQIKLVNIRRDTAEYKKEIAVQNDKLSRLKEKAKHNSSDAYYEEKARDEGYVGKDETVFVVGN